MLAGDEVGPAEMEAWLVFHLGDRQWAVELNRVVAIMEGRDLFPVPLISPRILGVTYWRDSALPVLKPEVLAPSGAAGGDEGEGRPALLAVMEQDGVQLGILFDRIERVVSRNELEEMEPGQSPTEGDERAKPWCRYRGRLLYRLDLEGILREVRESG